MTFVLVVPTAPSPAPVTVDSGCQTAVPLVDIRLCLGSTYVCLLLIDGGYVTIRVQASSLKFLFRPELRQDYPLNLSISISGGKETNKDSLSNGE